MNNAVDNLLTKSNETMKALISSTSITEAAGKLNISREALYKRIERFKLRPQLELIKQQTADNLLLSGIEASNTLVSKLKSRNENIQMEASKEILDRIGVTKKSDQTVIGQQNNYQVVIEDWEE